MSTRNNFRRREIARLSLAAVTLIAVHQIITSHENVLAGNPPAPRKKAPDKTAKVTERIIHFPAQSLGGLYVISKQNWGGVYDAREVAVAKGIVRLQIPPGSEVLLRANAGLMQHVEALDAVSPDSIECLDIRTALFNLEDEQFGNKLLGHISRLTGLRILRIMGLEPDDAGISLLKNLKKLELLQTNVGKLDGSCLKDLQTLPHLQELDISDNPINLKNLSCIGNFRELSHLEMHRCKLNKEAMQQISKCSTLTNLNLSGNPNVNDECAEHLRKMQNLTTLDLQSTKLTAHGLLQLHNLKNLRYVAISSGFVSPESLANLRKAMPNVNFQVKGASSPVSKDTDRIFAPMPK
jgi:hypothetical protein